jgi:sialate O-acetylesterase
MVFQRGEVITVKGFCRTDGNTVTVTLGDVSATATVSGGEWSLQLPAMEATTGLTLTVIENEPVNTYPTVYEDVAIGDVFILSGQSNMDYQAKYLQDYEEFLANADNFDNLRGYLVPNSYRHGENKVGTGTWYKLDKSNIGDFSAIGYVMATKLAAELDDVTIAIVDATYPGSIAKTWIDIDTYKEHFGDSHSDVKTYEAYLAFYQANGRCPTSASELSAWVGKSYQKVVASCYDSMIAFFDGYAAKATVWYQGEGDLSRVSEYPAYYQALTDSFRKTFNNDEMAFVVIQLAPYSAGSSINSFRAMQATLPSVDPYTYVVATSNEGAIYNDEEFINNGDISLVFVHTSVKSPIGLNAADVLLDKVYNIDGANTHLEIVSITRDGNTVTITFNQNVATGGVDEVLGFELAGSDGTFVMADAVLEGNTVTLTAEGVASPAKVRYGFGNFYIE